MEIVIGFMLFCFDIAGLLALGHIECGWKIPLIDRNCAETFPDSRFLRPKSMLG